MTIGPVTRLPAAVTQASSPRARHARMRSASSSRSRTRMLTNRESQRPWEMKKPPEPHPSTVSHGWLGVQSREADDELAAE
jgi:hypothetical protein